MVESICPYWKEEYGCQDECFIGKMAALDAELAATKALAREMGIKLTSILPITTPFVQAELRQLLNRDGVKAIMKEEK